MLDREKECPSSLRGLEWAVVQGFDRTIDSPLRMGNGCVFDVTWEEVGPTTGRLLASEGGVDKPLRRASALWEGMHSDSRWDEVLGDEYLQHDD